MTPSTSPDPRYSQLRTWYDQLTARIEALDRDIGWALSQHDRTIHKERRDVLVADRELVTAYLDTLERDQPLPGPWAPEFKTTDLLARPLPRILFKSGRCDFYRHIPLPPNYIPRPELLTEVRERLLRGTGGLALTSAIQVKQADVLHGMGGIGKSVLARALCDAPDVQAAFPDGILWATLGQTPDLTARLREWIETLGGIVGQTAPTLDQLRDTLAEALRDKACLLIVDDAWRKAHLEPFCAGGPRCRLLITTRDAALAEGLDAGVYPVPVMAPDQAVALLEEWAGESLAEVEAEVKAKIVRRLGCLPLAVRLAGAQLRQKDPTEWLASFDARKLKTRRVETLHDSLEATFALSLDALTPVDRRLHVALAIFKEDEPTPVVAIAKLWSALDGRDATQTNELLDDLAARALLARSQGDGDAVMIHDLLRDFMTAELGEEGRSASHRALLDAYYQTRQGDGWHTVPDDSYIHKWLAWHLQRSSIRGALDAMLGKETSQGRNGWYEARIRTGKLDGYVSDLRRAMEAAATAVELRLQIRYALMESSIHSLAEQFPYELLVGALRYENRVISARAVLNHIRQMPLVYQRSDALHDLASYLPEDQHLEALELALALAPENERGLLGLIPVLAPGLLEHALLRLSKQPLERRLPLFLVEAAPYLPDSMLPLALSSARLLPAPDSRGVALSCLVPRLSGPTRDQVILEAEDAITQGTDQASRAQVLAYLAPYLTPDRLDAIWSLPHHSDLPALWAFNLARAYLRQRRVDDYFATLHSIDRDRVWLDGDLLALLRDTVADLPVERRREIVDHLPLYSRRQEVLLALGLVAQYGTDQVQAQIVSLFNALKMEVDQKVVALAKILPHLRKLETRDTAYSQLHSLIFEPTHAGTSRFLDSLRWYEDIVDDLPMELVVLIVAVARTEKYVSVWFPLAVPSLHRLPEAERAVLCHDLLEEARKGSLRLDELRMMLNWILPHLGEPEREELFSMVLDQALHITDEDIYDPIAPYKAVMSGKWGPRPSRDYFREFDHVRVLFNMAPYASSPMRVARLAVKALDGLDPHNIVFLLPEVQSIMSLLGLKDRKKLANRILDVVIASALDKTSVLGLVHIKVSDVIQLLMNLPGLERQYVLDRIRAEAERSSSDFEKVVVWSLVIDYVPEPDRHLYLDAIREWCSTDLDLSHNTSLDWPGVDWSRGRTARTLLLKALGILANEPSPAEVSSDSSDHATLLGTLLQITSERDHKRRPQLLIKYGARWAALPTADASRMLQEVLPLLAQGSRGQLLWDLHAIGPVILRLGGEKAAESLIEEVERVRRWWS
jgi:hypothetical protein